MLYLKGYVHDFHDIDIMVADTDAAKMETILKAKGDIQPWEKGSYETKHFRKFLIDGVEIDMMGGLAIVKDGKVYDCDLKKNQITGNAEVDGQNIPLHSVKLWEKYYMLMGREEKAKIIEKNIHA